MLKSYVAFWDDGHDRGEFSFNSEHRANSKENIEDAKYALMRAYGYKRSRCMEILCTQRDYKD